MKSVCAISSSIISPLGFTSSENFQHILAAQSAVRLHSNKAIVPFDFWGSLFTEEQINLLQSGMQNDYSIFESMVIRTVKQALIGTNIDITSSDCIFILSTTKGNIELLAENKDVSIHTAANKIAQYFTLAHKPIVVSNACISGALSLIWAKRYIETGKYNHAIVVGADRVSGFVVSGFQSFMALAPEQCTPFDKDRKGINLGEAAACMILSREPANINSDFNFTLKNGGVSNDANHLSGPSRTGEELAQAINDAIKNSGVKKSEIGAISAHGTGTAYNDEMEAQAINIAGLSTTPIHSLKPLIGHTLGAAGIVESIIACMAMQQNITLGSTGYKTSGVSVPLTISAKNVEKEYRYVLKTASGFGGCNAAILWSKA